MPFDLQASDPLIFGDRVVFLIGPQNHRSQRTVEKIGGVRAGSRRDASGRESLVHDIRTAAPAQEPREA